MNTIKIITDKTWNHEKQEIVDCDFMEVRANPNLWITLETDDVIKSLMEFFGDKFPENANIYYEYISEDHDVTPFDAASVEKLQNLHGTFFVLAVPGSTGVIMAVIAIVVAVIAIAAAILLRPKIPSVASRGTQTANSSNNELSKRTNEARPYGRIPDIFGEIDAVCDMLTVPLSWYVMGPNGFPVKVEFTTLAIGRGEYTIYSAKDGTTNVAGIDGTDIEVFRPYMKINSDEPYWTVGNPIPDNTKIVTRANGINGQTLEPTNRNAQIQNANLTYQYPGNILGTGLSAYGFAVGDTLSLTIAQYIDQTTFSAEVSPLTNISFSIPYIDAAQLALYSSASGVRFTNANFTFADGTGINLNGDYSISSVTRNANAINIILSNPANVNSAWNQITSTKIPRSAYVTHIVDGAIINLSGNYVIGAISDSVIQLNNAATVNTDWLKVQGRPNQQIGPLNSTISKISEQWIGPIVLEDPNLNQILINLAAPGGLYYKNDGGEWQMVHVDGYFEVTPVDMNNAPIGPTESTYWVMASSSWGNERQDAMSITITPSFTGRCSIRGVRVGQTLTDVPIIADDVQWEDCYSLSDLPDDAFGNITIVKLKQVATTGALAVKERMLHFHCCREVPLRISGDLFTGVPYPTKNAADILSYISLDPKIGARTKAEIDFENLYNTMNDVAMYFETSQATEFCYTFDNTNLTFEETAAMIAESVFCRAYRRGNILRLNFEQEIEESTLLFNSRNKIPDSETRTIICGTEEDQDGVEFEYTSPLDDSKVTYYIPENRGAKNPIKHESVGVRNIAQAHLLAYRIYNKLMYKHILIEFDATQEANLLSVGDRILVSSNLKPDLMEGDVESVNGLVVYTSHEIKMQSGITYYAFLQLTDGTVQSIQATAGPEKKSFTLTQLPRLPLITDAKMYARTTYMLVSDTAKIEKTDVFLVAETDTQKDWTVTVNGVNYDARYYQNDKDVPKGLIPAEK